MNTGKIKGMTFKENIDKKDLLHYPLSAFKGDIVLVDSYRELKKTARILRKADILGFDTETKPSFRKGRNNNVALLQLSDSKTAYLFRLKSIGLPDEIAGILADRSIVKAGVAVHDDIKALKALNHFKEDGFIDLQDYVKKFGIESSGLQKLAAIIMGFRISKRQQVTNWEAPELSEAQMIYAATDAWVCYEIFKKLGKNTALIQ